MQADDFFRREAEEATRQNPEWDYSKVRDEISVERERKGGWEGSKLLYSVIVVCYLLFLVCFFHSLFFIYLLSVMTECTL